MTGRRMAAVGLCLALALSVCGCKSPAASGGAADATVWCASGTEKILRDTDYSARYGADTLEIAAFRNENEAAQIIVSGDAGTEYDVETAGLSGPDGASLPASAFTLYHEKYINVTEIKDLNAVTGVGMYPDALLPFGGGRGIRRDAPYRKEPGGLGVAESAGYAAGRRVYRDVPGDGGREKHRSAGARDGVRLYTVGRAAHKVLVHARLERDLLGGAFQRARRCMRRTMSSCSIIVSIRSICRATTWCS